MVGSADTQAEWAHEFDSFPCNTAAVAEIHDETPAIYTLKNFALETVEGTDMTYAEYVGAHSSEWTNIMTNLGFYWADNSAAPTEPDWDDPGLVRADAGCRRMTLLAGVSRKSMFLNERYGGPEAIGLRHIHILKGHQGGCLAA